MALPNEDSRLTRREAAQTVGRWFGMAVLAGLAAWLLRRGVGRGAAESSDAAVCGSCMALARCTLAQADEARRQGIGLVTPLRVPAPGHEADFEPLCAEGRQARGAARGNDAGRSS